MNMAAAQTGRQRGDASLGNIADSDLGLSMTSRCQISYGPKIKANRWKQRRDSLSIISLRRVLISLACLGFFCGAFGTYVFFCTFVTAVNFNYFYAVLNQLTGICFNALARIFGCRDTVSDSRLAH